MIQPLKKYPDDSINILSGPIRNFKETLPNILEDMIDTMESDSLDALSAIQIGYPYQVIVHKEDGKYVEYINPRIINSSKPFDSTERSVYFGDHNFNVKRDEVISIVYSDKDGNSKVKKIEDKLVASTLQRKSDYLFNASLLDRQNPNVREQAISALAGQGLMPARDIDLCPTQSKRQYFVSLADKLIFFMLVSLVLPLFGVSKSALSGWYIYDKYAFVVIILLMIGFFVYAWYEAKQFKQCTSCQVGNNIGVVIKRLTVAIVSVVISFFVLGAN